MVPLIEARLGIRLPDNWVEGFTRRLIEVFKAEAEPVPGAIDTLQALTAMRLPWRIASNSSHAELAAKFSKIGIPHLVAGRLHSHHDVPRGKPAPDLYLAAATAEGVAAAECLVIEDSVRGVQAAIAAEMQCLGFARHTDADALRAAGAAPFRSMFELPALIEAAPRLPA
jgi:HAD superfamily hydrolase (TIGR01509 family)